MTPTQAMIGAKARAELAAARRMLAKAAFVLADDDLNPTPDRVLAGRPDAGKVVALGNRLMRDQIDSEIGDPILAPDPEVTKLCVELVELVREDTGQTPLEILRGGIYVAVMACFAQQVVSRAVGYRSPRPRPARR
jgi:hypothetical protein